MKANAGNKFGEGPAARGSDAAAQAERAVGDPFADDLFAVRAPHTGQGSAGAGSEGGSQRSGKTDGVLWYSRLPRLTAKQARLSSELSAVSPAIGSGLVVACERALTRYANLTPEDISLTLVELREGPLPQAARETEIPRLRVSLAVEPQGVPLSFELEAAFCAALVDRMAGGEGVWPDSLRNLTDVEYAALEFLCLALLRELNAELGEPLFRLSGLGEVQPGGAQGAGAFALDSSDPTPYGWGLTVRVGAADTVGLVRCRVSAAALAALNAARNPLLSRRRAVALGEKVARLRRVAPEVTLRLFLGETSVELGELARMERDDVLIIEKLHAGLRGGRFAGRLRLRAGDGPGSVIVGTTRGAETGAGFDTLGEEALTLYVEEIHGGGGPGAAERKMMAVDETGGGTAEEGATPLDGLVLTVHVELAARRMSLESLAGLRVGQVMELDCKPTDPVDLIAEGRLIARGELVDIEGQLGVRVTQLFG
jgi:flagellar motor switch protein FliM